MQNIRAETASTDVTSSCKPRSNGYRKNLHARTRYRYDILRKRLMLMSFVERRNRICIYLNFKRTETVDIPNAVS